MLTSILNQLDQAALPQDVLINEEDWPTQTRSFMYEFEPITSKLMERVEPKLLKRLHVESTDEFIITTVPSVVVTEFRIRPKAEYFAAMGRRSPQPEDPLGNDATGIEVSVLLCRGFQRRQFLIQPFVSIEFGVWGAHERAAFAEMLRDHRFLVDRIVSSTSAFLHTACVFENMERNKQRRAFQRLSDYFENPEDAENNFSLEVEFGRTATETELSSTLLAWLLLYDAAMGYCGRRKTRDRLLTHLPVIQTLPRK